MEIQINKPKKQSDTAFDMLAERANDRNEAITNFFREFRRFKDISRGGITNIQEQANQLRIVADSLDIVANQIGVQLGHLAETEPEQLENALLHDLTFMINFLEVYGRYKADVFAAVANKAEPDTLHEAIPRIDLPKRKMLLSMLEQMEREQL